VFILWNGQLANPCSGGGAVEFFSPRRDNDYDYAQRILALHREARRKISGKEPPVAGELLLAASSIPGEHLLPALLSVFGQKHPHIQVRATVSDSMTAMAQVERGQVSLGLVGRKTDNPHLEFKHLASDKMVLVVPKGHVLSRRKKLSLKQLAGHLSFIGKLAPGCGTASRNR